MNPFNKEITRLSFSCGMAILLSTLFIVLLKVYVHFTILTPLADKLHEFKDTSELPIQVLEKLKRLEKSQNTWTIASYRFRIHDRRETDQIHIYPNSQELYSDNFVHKIDLKVIGTGDWIEVIVWLVSKRYNKSLFSFFFLTFLTTYFISRRELKL